MQPYNFSLILSLNANILAFFKFFFFSSEQYGRSSGSILCKVWWEFFPPSCPWSQLTDQLSIGIVAVKPPAVASFVSPPAAALSRHSGVKSSARWVSCRLLSARTKLRLDVRLWLFRGMSEHSGGLSEFDEVAFHTERKTLA